jgi:hypothetical protein
MNLYDFVILLIGYFKEKLLRLRPRQLTLLMSIVKYVQDNVLIVLCFWFVGYSQLFGGKLITVV